jgi:hypothetical protein
MHIPFITSKKENEAKKPTEKAISEISQLPGMNKNI